MRLAVIVVALAACGSRDCPAPPPPPPPAPDAAPSPTKAAFEKVYDDATWGTNDSGVGHSGVGSTENATQLYRVFLEGFLKDANIHSVVDAGCGDWEFSKLIDWTGIDYKGFDIVDKVIAADKKQFEKPNIHFFQANIIDADLPPADLLIVKHVLQHLPNADVAKLITQFHKYKHVIVVNGVNALSLTAPNTDIKPGEYRELDITRPPFSVHGLKMLTYFDKHHMHQVLYIPGGGQ
jgi:SAM-dependent methyltransferase